MIPTPHRIGEVGVALRATFVDQDGTVIDLSSATSKEIRLESPKGVSKQLAGQWPAGEDGTQGNVEGVTVLATIDEIGTWKWQGHATGPSFDIYTEIATFKAESNL